MSNDVGFLFSDDLIQYTAITWLQEFIALAGRTMLPHLAGILNATLPCLSYSDNTRKKYTMFFKILVEF